MSRVLTNESSFAVALEESIGTLPATPSWHLLEPTGVSKAGSEITEEARRPISKNRQNRKGAVTDLDSGWDAELDLTREHLLYLVPAMIMAVWTGPRYYQVTGVTATGYTVAANGDLPQGTLVVPTGFRTAANNSPESFKVVGAASIATEIKVAGLTAEVIPADGSQNALIEVAGRRGASGDLEIDANGDLISTALDFTTLRLNVGQFIWIGGEAGSVYAFATAANRGLARITSIAANKITFDKTTTTFVEDDGTGKTIDLYFGRWARNVAVDHADYLVHSLCIETTYTNLGGVGTDYYSYARGNLINEATWQFDGQSLAKLSIATVGMDTQPPAADREPEADTPMVPVQVTAYNTAADFSRLRVTEVDESGITSDIKDLQLTFGNNVSPEKILGVLGARYMNLGLFDVMGEMNVVLTDVAVMEAVRDNRLMTMEIGIRNGDGAFIVDMPSITLSGGVPEFTPDESVTLPLNFKAVQDTVFGYTTSVSCFPYLPAS
jgi:hypothetical protein